MTQKMYVVTSHVYDADTPMDYLSCGLVGVYDDVNKAKDAILDMLKEYGVPEDIYHGETIVGFWIDYEGEYISLEDIEQADFFVQLRYNECELNKHLESKVKML